MRPEAPETRAVARRRLAMAFAQAGIQSPDVDARLFVCAAAGLDHAELIRDPDVALTPYEVQTLAGFTARRLAREPVSRILGRREFWGLALDVSPAVLDPRPETEGLVALVRDAVAGRRDRRFTILDLGTGSGAILAALLHELPRAIGVGVDRSPAACQIARRNLAAHGLADRSGVLCGDWADALATRFDILVSNPPYIATGELAGLAPDVRDYDPLVALDGGADGLDAYRTIVASLPSLLRPGAVVAFECGTGQGAEVVGLLRDIGIAGAAVCLDLAGHDRVVIATT